MSEENLNLHKLNDTWNLWAHLSNDSNWNLKSYRKLSTLNYVEDILSIYQLLDDNLVKNCMLFLMRDNITPMWEDENNINGGCFSYKINNRYVVELWKNLSYLLVGENISSSEKFNSIINGITISPKKNFCIIKIWLKTCDYSNPNIIDNIESLSSEACFFKKHN